MSPKLNFTDLIFFLISLSLFCFLQNLAHASSSNLINPDKIRYPSISFTPHKGNKSTFPNGLVLYIIENIEIPIVNISIVVRTGAAYDPEGKEGLTELAGKLMRTGGTQTMSGDAVDEMLEYLACNLTVTTKRDALLFNLSVMKKNLDQALEIMSNIIKHPLFAKEKIDIERELKIEEIRRIVDDPSKFAFREFNRLIYKSSSQANLATITSLKNINRDDLLRFHKQFISPNNIMMTVSGDININEAVEKIQKHFGEWEASGLTNKTLKPPEKKRGNIFFLSKDIPQSIIIYGSIAPGIGDVDKYSFEILDFIVGSGGFKSRIFSEIRSRRGLAYSAGSFYRQKSNYGVFGVYAITSSESTFKAYSLMHSILIDMINKTINKRELDWAKKSINNNFIFSFSTPSQIVHQQMMNDYYNLPDDYLLTYRDKISTVSQKDVRSVAAKYLSEENTFVLIVGNESVYKTMITHFSKIQKIEGVL